VASVGHPKVEIAAKKLQALNPEVKVDPVPLSVDFDTAKGVIEDVDIVVDGLDRFAPRYALNRACVEHKVPYVFGAALEVYGNLSTIIPGETACLECLFPDVRDESLPTCESVGVLPPVPSLVASIQVQEALNLILGKEPRLTNKLLFCDPRSMQFEEFPFAKRADCSACGKVPVEVSMVEEKRVAELCGKDAFMVTPAERISLDMPGTAELLSKKFHVKVRAHFGVTFDMDGVSVSLMKTGYMLIKGVKDQETALKIYDDIMRVVAS
jgi:adenylyltransferase/sulfurtransferase